MQFADVVEGGIEAWQGIPPPNKAGRIFAADLAASIAALQAVRVQMRFEDEPSSFELALQACKE